MALNSQRLLLKPVQQSNLDDLFRIYGDPATNTFNPSGPFPDIHYAESVLKEWLQHWKDNNFGYWAISTQNVPDKVIGFGGISVKNYANMVINNLGYRLETASWGQGYATELSKFIIQYGFMTLLLPEISATVRKNHQASKNVLLKSEMQYIREIADANGASPSLFFTLKKMEWLILHKDEVTTVIE
ncbi:GNAT family N-acetyltransferase [Salmonella enterica subsp. enterica serovar Wilhelmsburg]|uniref:GNAT family N-acetyltransferase n=1 Tax=Salmonella enterica subsp. enterica serovar Wilhelmsburg TaxID=1960126 RepID=A0A659P435_SALET|nr:GNAT family N-acetyltransferase [Salmonella enterica]TGC64039.1 GNAT family N-acetyltransferase [Salmonella enterica subsp. enterica serovar Wilhelmsburg]TGC73276.1 GNAT family N-acetyltransferase [Salmonella enterica subsp. enterica serovar Wilhelmsburg]TGC80009.1 GNAT family N-acetyltransferase [Salmonella enterica subsp. enterica serovar Wilhelmsburg]TGC88268.1 GNAT family N-acetyltransferase [Salmonella enterica subsp. enterica serovar Wilhelmsburg]TGC90336.1 GNAT family N-acetyltransfe